MSTPNLLMGGGFLWGGSLLDAPAEFISPSKLHRCMMRSGILTSCVMSLGVASEGKTRSSVMDEALRKYARALGVHGDDKMLNRDE